MAWLPHRRGIPQVLWHLHYLLLNLWLEAARRLIRKVLLIKILIIANFWLASLPCRAWSLAFSCLSSQWAHAWSKSLVINLQRLWVFEFIVLNRACLRSLKDLSEPRPKHPWPTFRFFCWLMKPCWLIELPFKVLLSVASRSLIALLLKTSIFWAINDAFIPEWRVLSSLMICIVCLIKRCCLMIYWLAACLTIRTSRS